MSDDALTAAARAAASRLKQHRTWKVEPRELTADSDGFDGVIRVHKMGRKLRYRDYAVTGTLQLADTLVVRPTTINQVGKKGFMGVYGPFMKGQVRKQIMRFNLDTDPVVRLPLGKMTTILKLTDIERVGEGLRLSGSLSTETSKP